MTDSNQIDATMLVLKMVGGTLDGKLLPISTQKCFLSGGEKNNQDQCAIIRGPSGTAIKSTESIFVNDHADTLHWLNEGDTIRIGQTTMVVQQLGSFGEATVSPASDTNHFAESLQTQTAVQEPPTETTAELNNSENQDTVAGTEHAEMHDSHSELRDFLNKTEPHSAGADNSATPKNDTELRQEEPSIEPNLSNELLERALNSLKNPSNTPIEDVAPQQHDAQIELSTEQNVDQQLDDIQYQIESQIESYDSISDPVLPIPSFSANESETVAENTDHTTAEEFSADPQPLELPTEEPLVENLGQQQQSIEEIMNRLRNSGPAPVEEPSPLADTTHEEPAHETSFAPIAPSVPEIPAPLESPAVDTTQDAEATVQQQTLESEESTSEPPSLHDIMSRLGPAEPDSTINEFEQATEQPQVMEPVGNSTEVEAEEPTTEAPSLHDVTSMLGSAESDSTADEFEQATEHPQFLQPVANPAAAETEEPTTEPPSLQNVMSQLSAAALDAPANEGERPPQQPQAIEPAANATPAAPEVQAAETTPTTPTVQQDDNSVAAVLARMQSAGQFTDFDPDNENQESSVPAGQSVTEPIRQPPEPEVTSEETDDGGDVQDYMNQLFQRLRGSDAPESVVQKPEPQEPSVPDVRVEEAPPEPVQQVDRVLSATEYVPKQQAPEVKSDLEAMRQLANQQKESAVQASSSKKSQIQQTINQCVAVACFVIAVFLGRMATSMTDPLAMVSFGCGVASLMGFFRYVFGMFRKQDDDETEPTQSAARKADPTPMEPQ